jgi:hypothetical protein
MSMINSTSNHSGCLFHCNASDKCYCCPPALSQADAWNILGTRYKHRNRLTSIQAFRLASMITEKRKCQDKIQRNLSLPCKNKHLLWQKDASQGGTERRSSLPYKNKHLLWQQDASQDGTERRSSLLHANKLTRVRSYRDIIKLPDITQHRISQLPGHIKPQSLYDASNENLCNIPVLLTSNYERCRTKHDHVNTIHPQCDPHRLYINPRLSFDRLH